MKTFALIFVALAAAACAPEVRRESVVLSESSASRSQVVLDQGVRVQLDSGYDRTIAVGTTFAAAGTIAQGRVLRPTNTVISVEGSHVHEAWPVVRDGRLVGFYLPVERAFTTLSSPVAVSLSERKAP